MRPSHIRRKRKKPRFHRHSKPGAIPGALHAAPDSLQPVVELFAYDQHRLITRRGDNLDVLSDVAIADTMIVWINVDGFGDIATIRAIGERYGLHSLALEDVINVHQRPKVEPYQDHLFVVARMVAVTSHDQLETEQLGLFLGRNFVLTFQQRPGDCFDPVRERLRSSRGSIRREGADYLAYALIDAVIDSYFPIVERYADQLDELEDEVASGRGQGVTSRIHEVRNELLLLRRSVRPHREALNELVRDLHPLIGEDTRVYLRGCYDHTVQLIDLLEVYREMCADLRDFYLSLVSQRMNEVMKVLTIIATIFMPLGFLAGLYGMNFNANMPGNMPELNVPYGYFGALGLMLMVALGMVFFFWRRGWIGRSG